MTEWSPDYLAELNRRIRLIHKLNASPELQAQAKAIYKSHPIAWIEDFAFTYDPRRKSLRTMPFILFDRQKDFIRFLLGCMKDKESGLVEKSRDMGASWLCCAFSVWLWLYHPGTAIGWGSRKEEYIDKKGDMKAIFPKINMLLERLPSFMLPEGFEPRIHSTHMKIINPENGASITGEAGDNIGRGGRTTIYFKDESAYYERPDSIEAALGDNTDVQIDISSVHGTGNVFYRRRMAGVEWQRDKEIEKGKTRVFIMDWRDHPLKTEEWYNRRRKKAEEEGLLAEFAQEVDRDYISAVKGIIIEPQWVRAAIDAHIKLGFRDDGEKVAGQDVADEGGDKNALAIRSGVILKFIDHWAGDAGDAAKIAIPICDEFSVKDLYYDSIGVGSGFKVGVNNLREDNALPKHLRVFPWNAGASVLEPEDHIIPNDEESPTNEDFYENLKAQAWWSLRVRFKKTYEAIMNGAKYDPGELVSIPSNLANRHTLERELSQAVRKYSKKGKTMVDKKANGATSPNLADAVVMCYYPAREVSILDVL